MAADGTGTSRGLVNGDTLSGSLSTSANGTSGIGGYTIDASALNNANYVVTANNGTLTITKRAVTVTANDVSKTYGDANPALSYTVAADGTGTSRGLVNGDVLNGNLTTTATRSSAAGDYPIDASALANPLANPNYLVTAKNGIFTVETAISTNVQPDAPVNNSTPNTPDLGVLKFFQPPNNQSAQQSKRPQCLSISVEIANPSISDSGSTGNSKPCVIVLPGQRNSALDRTIGGGLFAQKVMNN